MTHVGPAPITSTVPGTSFVEWGAVFAGAVVAAALSFVFLTFAAGIGLSLVSPWPNSGVSGKLAGSLAAFFILAQQIGAFLIGGYVAGRMRSRWNDVTQDEVDFRDGLHGALVWGIGVAIGAALIFATAGATAKTAANLAGPTAANAANAAMDTVVDTMLRPTVVAQAPAPTTAPATPGATPAQAQVAVQPATADTRAEIGRVISAAVASGSLTEPNRTYLAQLISRRTGISQSEAEKRVDDAVRTARDSADKARRASMLASFIAAASLVISLAAAWWAACKGGNHRDNNVPARFDVNRGIIRPQRTT